MNEDKRRKTKVEVRKIPAPVEWMLKNCTSEQLNYFDRLSRNLDFRLFIKLVADFKHYNVYEVFRAPFSSPEELVAIRAAKVGEVVGLDALVMMIQMARAEIERRKKLKP